MKEKVIITVCSIIAAIAASIGIQRYNYKQFVAWTIAKGTDASSEEISVAEKTLDVDLSEEGWYVTKFTNHRGKSYLVIDRECGWFTRANRVWLDNPRDDV